MRLNGTSVGTVVALKADIWDTRSIVKGGKVIVPSLVNFNIGTGKHTLDIIQKQNDREKTPVFSLQYVIQEARSPKENAEIVGMMTKEVYRGIGIGSVVIEKFLGSFYKDKPITLIAASDTAERFWTSVGFTTIAVADMVTMSRYGTNVVAYPSTLNGMYSLKYKEDQSIQLELEDSIHIGGTVCRICSTNKHCTAVSCTHYVNQDSDTLVIGSGTTTEDFEFNRLDLQKM
jgi:hypothetical protein